MYIKSIELTNFRNYEKETILMNDGLNVVIGKNAMGKTNLLESICCCGIGKSTKTTKYKELINWNKKYAYIKIILSKKYRDHTIEFVIDDKDKKRVRIDGVQLTKLIDLVGILNIVFFSPDELKLVKESPQERRRFINISLSQQSKLYIYSLSRYEEALSQRNKLLKMQYTNENIQEMLNVWDPQIAKEAAFICLKRYEFIDKLKEIAKEIHSELTNNKEDLCLEYESLIKRDSIENMEKQVLELLKDSKEKDIKLQYTSIGPHRDDMDIKINGIDIRKFGSQGQQRTVALSLKLAEIKLFNIELGETPVLLLDDVLSELDGDRRKKLMKLSSNLQTIITCTDFDMDIKHNRIEISNGKRVN